MSAFKRCIFLLAFFFLGAKVFAQFEERDVYELIKTSGAKEIREFLKANKNLKNQKYGPKGDSLLMAAVDFGRDSNIISALLLAGVNPDATNDDGDTAIIIAVKRASKKKILQMLISYDTEFLSQRRRRVFMKNKEGKSALDFAEEGSEQMKVLKRYARKKKSEGAEDEIDIEDNEFLEEVDAAEEKSEESEAEKSEEAETAESEKAEEIFEEEKTEEAAQTDEKTDEDLLAMVLQAEEALKKRERPKRRAYLFDGFEAFDTYGEKTESLVSQPNALCENGLTLLQDAAKNDDAKKIALLLKSGAEADLCDADGWTALMFAARFAKNAETVLLLIQGGADAKAKNRFGQTALEIAASYSESQGVLKEIALASAKKDLKAAFVAAVGLGRPREILQVFLSLGVSVNCVHKGKTALMHAAQSNTHTECIEFLLENGADKTLVNAERRDAFFYAKQNPNLPRNDVFWSLNNSEN